ncbi:hypothetical protein [Erythrobacter insulae]|uniref:hypothetical protein n=1 Tax=Erythrobacter insulae TaxID=2584124 RepID=UPI00163DA7C0|nr:hypothetical protein [Erythrobacter insulae]
MTDMAIISLVSLIGWLLIAGSAFASYRLGWNKALRMALIWIAIFGGAFLLVGLLM